MKKTICILFMLFAFVVTSCSPKITGIPKRKKNKGKNCGCELVLPEKVMEEYA